MKGAYHLVVRSAHLKYELDIIRNITIIQGDSATGKTTLADMIREYVLNGTDTGITISCNVPCRLIEGNTWREQLEPIHNSIVFIDEGNKFISSVDFANAIKNSDNYYVIITRESLQTLPYSVTEIYGIHSSGKYNSLEPVYHSLYRIYGSKCEICGNYNTVLVEDSNAGYEFYKKIFGDKVNCISANGKDKIFGFLNNRNNEEKILVIADGAAFGSQMSRVSDAIRRIKEAELYLPESFEWIILESDILGDSEVQKIVEQPETYIDSKKYFSWERFFTALLVSKSEGTYLKYSKDKLNSAYLQERIVEKIMSHLPIQKSTFMANNTTVSTHF